MDHSTHVRLTDAEITEANLADAVIYGPDDEVVGRVSHLHGSGRTARVVLDVGGFLGLMTKPVALSVTDLDLMRDTQGTVHGRTSYGKDEIKALPAHTEKT